jgi:hypothetical protein
VPGSSLKITNNCNGKVRVMAESDLLASIPLSNRTPLSGRVFADNQMEVGETLNVDMSYESTRSRILFSFPGCPADHFHWPEGVLPAPRPNG